MRSTFAPPSRTSHLRLTLALLTATLAGTSSLGAQQQPEPIKFARYAHVANDGTIAFTYQDDIWIADADGRNPRRLTAHIARDYMPRFSPDGRMIAFTSNRMGNDDIYVVPLSGGEPKQLTWMSTNEQALNWSPDGKQIIISSNRGPHPFGSPLYALPLDGTMPTPMGMDFGRSGMMKQDATFLAFNRSVPTYWRKGYRGNNNADIAVQDDRRSRETGGLSGEPLMNKSTAVLRMLRTRIPEAVPLVGVGGILSGADAVKKMAAGASLVQLYTGLVYRGPGLIGECVEAIRRRKEAPSRGNLPAL